MRRMMRSIVLLAPICFAGCAAQQAGGPLVNLDRQVGSFTGEKLLINRDGSRLALQGYDPVAYFTENMPVKGDPQFRAQYRGAIYHFASQEHQDKFAAEPAKYEPQFGGYCGYAASINRLSPISPQYFQVLDGRLVLQHNQKAYDLWNKDVAGNLVKADTHWPELVAKNGSAAKLLVNVDKKGVALEGHDPVAYFTLMKPTPGDPKIEAVFNGAKYHFVSEDNRKTFENDPMKYAPAFGGFCGYAASIKKISPVNINIFQIIDGRLVLQHTPKAYELFNKDPNGSLHRADANWPGLVEQRGK